MTTSDGRGTPRRPVHFGPDAMEAHGGTTPGPAELTEVAHQTAAVIVGTGRAAHDPEVTAKLVALVDDLGLSTIADLWSGRPARSLPGVLWRLYVLREWVRRTPEAAAREYAAGMRLADVSHVVAGVAVPPGPEEVQALTEAILTGVFDGDLAIALERAAAFCAVISAGRAALADDAVDFRAETERAARMLQTSHDLRACAALWRADDLS